MRDANFLGGSSQAQCVMIWNSACADPPPAGETFDTNCSGGKHVNTAAKTACLDELSTITCDNFNSPTYTSVCNQVCTAGGGTGGAGGGGAGGGGGGSNGACGTVEPCGGNVAGTWTFTSECISVAALQPQAQSLCAQASITSASASVSGSATFNTNASYSVSEMVTAVIGWNIPASCLSGSTCDYFGSQIQAGLGAGQTFTCTGTSNCSCTQGLLTNIADSGSYGSAGSNLVLTSTVSGTTSTGGYCVQGSTLHLLTVDATMSTGPGGGPAINQDVVAQKQ